MEDHYKKKGKKDSATNQKISSNSKIESTLEKSSFKV